GIDWHAIQVDTIARSFAPGSFGARHSVPSNPDDLNHNGRLDPDEMAAIAKRNPNAQFIGPSTLTPEQQKAVAAQGKKDADQREEDYLNGVTDQVVSQHYGKSIDQFQSEKTRLDFGVAVASTVVLGLGAPDVYANNVSTITELTGLVDGTPATKGLSIGAKA